MQAYFGAFTIVVMIAMILARGAVLKKRGIAAFKFGEIDRTDFLIPPFGLFYFYLIFANAFDWPTIRGQAIFHSPVTAWVGVLLCLLGLSVLLWSLVSFGRSFRIGIDLKHSGELVTTGVFAYSRNPIYVAFASVLAGQFLIFPSWILLVYIAGGVLLFHRQVLREEAFLKKHYGQRYAAYAKKVRRYI